MALRTQNGDTVQSIMQSIQAAQYEFPYHYIPSVDEGELLLSRHWSFAASYVAALDLVASRLRHDFAFGEIRHVDIGCGDGALINYLTQTLGRGAGMFTGVDIDGRSIKWARLFNPKAEFYAGNVSDLQGSFRSATMVEVLEHIPPENLSVFLRDSARKLESNGLLLVTVPSVEKELAEKHFQHFSIESLQSVLGQYFDIEQVVGFEREDLITWFISKLRSNRLFKLDAPKLNRIAVNHLARTFTSQKGCGRLFAVCRCK